MEQEDLTASHWDDVISPNTNTNSALSSHSVLDNPLNNQFQNLSLNTASQSYYGQYDEDEEDDEENDQGDNVNIHEGHEDTNSNIVQSNYNDYSIPNINDNLFASTDNYRDNQLNDLKKEERKEHRDQLLSELTHGTDEGGILDSSVVSSKQISTGDSLFHDKGSPIKVKPNQQTQITSPKRPINLKNSQLFRAPRPRKFSGQINAKFLGGEASNSSEKENNGSLGPLGSNQDDSKSNDRSSVMSSTRAELLAKEADAPLYEIQSKKTDEQKIQEFRTPESKTSDAESKIPIAKKNGELPPAADNNKLVISVGDPMKVGDITTAHIVYSIKTKNTNPETKHFPIKTEDNVIVSRRYKDFRWIYHQLQNNHPGRIIPPPPSKQTYIGRFNESFIENRRLSLEKMLSKISNIPILANDADFVMFLTSEDFANESKERERLSGSGASTQNNEFLDNAITANDANSVASGSSASTGGIIASTAPSGGFMSSFFSIPTKINEPDEYFIDKKQYIDELEYNLKQLYLAIELVGNQRNALVGVYDEISLTLDELAGLEISKITTELLGAFSQVQLKIKENLDRVNLQDQLTLGFSIEEYLRIIGSIKFVFETRAKIYQQFYTFNQELAKKQVQLDKSIRKYGSTQQEKLNLLQFEVDKLKQKTSTYESSFQTISETIKEELDNFEIEKIENFRNSVEIFIESSIESQKEAIELYETFYERQNLANV
ncbi:Vps5 C terminal like-domain-containing protein [Scheffersomyces amazonensis]|uniref:Vps5 C terminal like-domain-containing protein n=1 Tax=Scheffersomyces amazonensis TaxID=1078765 RepID=UPI00315C8D81